jgi:hypothetical protein
MPLLASMLLVTYMLVLRITTVVGGQKVSGFPTVAGDHSDSCAYAVLASMLLLAPVMFLASLMLLPVILFQSQRH